MKVSAFIRAIALVEILAILFSGFTIASYASPLQTLDDPSDKEAAESLALDYIGNFVDNSYLYETNDLHKPTILSLFDDQSDSYAIASYSSVAFPDGTELSLSEMSDQLENFICVADYYRYIRQRQNFQRYDFTFTPQIIKASVDKTSATVSIFTHISFRYLPDDEIPAEADDNYTIRLVQLDETWYIAGVECEAFEAYGLTDLNHNYEERIAQFDAGLAYWEACESALQDFSELETTAPPVSGFNISFDSSKATAYAYTYTTSGSGGSSFYNPLFPNLDNYGGNCQNFASQCVWAGFNGSNDSTSITNRKPPMCTYENCWAPGFSSWSTVSGFKGFASSSHNANTGMQAEITTHTNNCFSNCSSSDLLGAVLHVITEESNPNYGHAIVLTDVIPPAYTNIPFNKVKFCANHAMRKACILSDHYSGPVRLIVPRYMREATVCIDGSGNEHNAHRFAGANGYPCNVCSYCGYNKLRVSGNLLRPIPVGSTRTLYGTANMSCYRMAIAVRYENGTNSWTESLSCSQITRSYTFTQAGLYTITVCARDLNDSNANSIANTFTYTIRVYS